MELDFRIHEDYLIAHTLASRAPRTPTSEEYEKAIVGVQNAAWHISPQAYNLLAGQWYPDDLERAAQIAATLPAFFRTLKQHEQFTVLRDQTQQYLTSCKEQWERNEQHTTEVVYHLTRFDLDRSFIVFITHPGLRNGCHVGDQQIAWGHSEDWPNYTTVYLWHEILHARFARNDTDHALIQFIADNELRVQLNGGTYPPFMGHKYLFPVMERLLPQWRQYLATEAPRDVATFRRSMTG